jgi:hypothetical protein
MGHILDFSQEIHQVAASQMAILLYMQLCVRVLSVNRARERLWRS